MKTFILTLIAFFNSAYADTTIVVLPIADTYVTSEAEQRNYGSESLLDLKTYYAGTRLLIKFDPGEIQNILHNKDLVSARLELPIQNHYISRDGDIGLFKMNVDWSENGATWKCPNDTNTSNYAQDCSNPWLMWSHDPNNTIPYPYDMNAFSVGRIVPNQAVPVGFDVADYIKNLSSSQNYGFAVFKITQNINEPLAFYSRESDVGPKIIIVTKDKVPEINKTTAKISSNVTAGNIPLTVNFDASLSKAKNGNEIEKIELDIGSGFVPLDKSNPVYSHSFQVEGEYQAILKVTDSTGEVSVAALNISAMGAEHTSYDQNYGYWINVPQNLNIKFNSGDSALLKGDVCKIWRTQNKDGNCQWVDKQRVQIRAFFPDMTTEVSSQLNVTTASERRNFTYQTPSLDKNKLNVLTVMVGEIDPTSIQFGALKTKIEMRIMVLDQKLADYEAQGVYPEVLKVLRDTRATLHALVGKIDQRNAKVPTLLAQYNLPLQVDNKVSAEKYYSTMIGGLRYELSSESGNLYQGEKAQIKSRVTNIDYRPNNYNPVVGYVLKYSYRNAQINTQTYPTFSKGESKEYIYQDQLASNVTDLYSFGVEVEEKYQWWAQKLGSTEFSLKVLEDNVSPTWLNPNSNTLHVSQVLSLEERVIDSFGRLDKSSFKAIMSGKRNADITDKFQFFTTTNGTEYALKANAQNLFLEEGAYEISYEISDSKGNKAIPNSYTRKYVVDRTPPQVFIASSQNFITNNQDFHLSFTALDANGVSYEVYQNGNLIFQGNELVFDNYVQLEEGVNNFKIKVVDEVGNFAPEINLTNIVLDTIPPALNNLPVDNLVLNGLHLAISGNSNEKLLKVTANGNDLVLASNKKDFSGNISFNTEGDHLITFIGHDLAGNITSADRNIKVALSVFNKNLIAIEPTSNGTQLLIKGAPSATRGNVDVKASAGFFNSKTVTSNADGSFSIVLDPFSKVTILATDYEINRSESFEMTYVVDTSLAGIVKDIDGVPLPGVVVTIKGTTQSATTGIDGTFRISDPVTGDQKLLIDGTTIPANIFNGLKKFAAVTYSVSIGITQSNVIERPIYLSPNYNDGSETKIQNGAATVVTSSHAAGVELNIPANSVVFPNGTSTGAISIIEVSSDRTTVAPPSFAKPDTVYALEPSGTKFSTPVELRLPNENEFPEGMELVILSKNSLTGEWEIDGVAKVEGNEIVTKDGMGITHFSEVYASPLGAEIKEVGAADVPGADTFGGAYSASVKMPSFKSLGQIVTPELLYKSSWANPNVVVKNIFDIPRQEITKSSNGRIVTNDVIMDYEEDLRTWIEPEYIEAQFFTTNIIGKKVKYTGVPRNAVVSYGMDLASLKSGVHPYLANYGIQLKKMYLSTQRLNATALGDAQFENGSKTLVQNKLSAGEIFRSIYPTDLRAPLYIQNKKNSEVGAGWRIKGIQKILNPNDNRIIIEESDGAISTYSIENKIQTILRDTTGMKAADFYSWPLVSVINNSNQIKKIDISNLSSNNIQAYPVTEKIQANTGKFVSSHGYMYNFGYNPNLGETYTVECNYKTFPFVRERSVNSILMTQEGYYGLNGDGELFVSKDNLTNHLIGLSDTRIPKYSLVNMTTTRSFTHPNTTSFCQNTAGLSCGTSTELNQNSINSVAGFFAGCQRQGPNVGEGSWYYSSFADGSFSSAALNGPVKVIAHPSRNSLVVADYGNNRIREVNIGTSQISTIVGDGRTSKEGDGGSALNAGIYHPRGIAYDSNGNLYIATEDGYIRKVNNNGVISTFAGLPVNLGGSLEEVTTADKVALSNPSGLIVDNTHGYLYVADSGNRRVLRVNLSNKIVQVIAGNGVCVTNPLASDNKPALEANLCNPSDVGLDDENNLLVLDKDQNAVRRVVFTTSTAGQLSYASTQKDNSSLVRNLNGSFSRTYRNGVVVEFDKSGNQLSTTDRGNRKIQFSYDNLGRLVSQVDPTGSAIEYNYSGNFLSSVTDPAGRVTSFNYSSGQLVEVNYPDNTSMSFVYDEKGLMTEYRDQESNTASIEYNSLMRMKKVTDPMGNSTYFDDSESRLAGNYAESEDLVQIHRTGLNVDDVNDKVIDSNGNITTYVEDENGYIEFIVNGEGKKTEYQRDYSGKLLKIIKPDQNYREFQYNSTGDLVAEYDSEIDVTVRKEYDSFGNLVSYTNPHGVKITNTFNNEGLLISSTSTEGDSASQVYNSHGLVSEVTNSLGNKLFYEYDQYGNVSKITNHTSNVTAFVRDAAGNVIQRTNANGDKTTYQYDLFNRLIAVTSPKLEITSIYYTPAGNVLKVIDPKGNIRLYGYDANGNMISKTDPENKTTLMAYDGNKNLTRLVDEGGREQTFNYNASNKIVKKILVDNVYSYNYDDSGRIIEISDSKTQININYNPQNQLSGVISKGIGSGSDLPNTSLSYEYDELGNRTGMTDSTGDTSYFYDGSNRLTKVINQNNETFNFSYNLVDNLTSVSRPGSSTSFTYDPTEYLKSITHTGSAGISFYDYERDATGNRLVKRTPAGDYNYSYDANEQLVSASNPDAQSPFNLENFSYDELGNRTDNGQQYDPKKLRITEDFKYTYIFDVYGNLTSKIEKPTTSGNVTNYIYNSENLLTGVDVFKNNILVKEVDFIYDALGRRVKKSVIDHEVGSSKVRKYAYDGVDLIQEFNEDNQLLAKYTYSGKGVDDILSVRVTSDGRDENVAQSAGSFYFLKDAIGTITDITNSSGAIVQKYVYSAFGKILKVKDNNNLDISANPILQVVHTFTGREYDSEIELYNYRARYYDPNMGRFLQIDPHPGELSNPLSYINKYIYVLNNPINATDPLGLFSLKKIFKGIEKGVKKIMSNKIAGLIISTVAGGPIGSLAYINMSGQFSQKDVALVNLAVVTAAAVATGGAAGAAFGAAAGGGAAGLAAGAVAGAVAGGITGGVVGGSLSVMGGGSFVEGFGAGMVTGMIAGGLAGAFAGYGATGNGQMLDEVSTSQSGVLNISTTTIERNIVYCSISLGLGTVGGAGALYWAGYSTFIASAATPIGWGLWAIVGAGTLVGAAGGFSLGSAIGCN